MSEAALNHYETQTDALMRKEEALTIRIREEVQAELGDITGIKRWAEENGYPEQFAWAIYWTRTHNEQVAGGILRNYFLDVIDAEIEKEVAREMERSE